MNPFFPAAALAGSLLSSAPAMEPAEVVTRVAFGSCVRLDKPQDIWDPILAGKPDLFLMLGDNVYADTEDMEAMREKYARLDAIPGFARLRRSVPILGTWDDHDYGVNDGGAEYPKRARSQQVFLDFFREPVNSPRRAREGIYDSKVWGPPGKRVQVILLDTRYFRSPLLRSSTGAALPDPNPSKTILGESQWAWLEEQLRAPAEVRLIVSSIQVVAEEHRFEKWANFPLERQRLLNLLRATRATGVIFLSGDRHFAELSQMDGGVGYPLYDLTSSSLTSSRESWRTHEPNRHRVGAMNWEENYGVIEIDWKAEDPRIRLEIRDTEGDVSFRKKITLGALRPGVADRLPVLLLGRPVFRYAAGAW